LPFIPLSGNTGPLLKILVTFAVGGLLGDVFLHLLPHALDPHTPNSDSHSHSHGNEGGHSHTNHLIVGLSVLAGILVFFIIEKTARGLHGSSHSHSHSHAPGMATTSSADDSDVKEESSKSDSSSSTLHHRKKDKDSKR